MNFRVSVAMPLILITKLSAVLSDFKIHNDLPDNSFTTVCSLTVVSSLTISLVLQSQLSKTILASSRPQIIAFFLVFHIIWARAEILGEIMLLLVMSPVPISSFRKFVRDSRTLRYVCKFFITWIVSFYETLRAYL